MENSVSPSLGVKRLDAEIRQILRQADLSGLNLKERETLAELQQDLVDARIYSNGYELSETRNEQLKNAKTAKKWLNKTKRCVLSLSEQNIFGAVDVAALSAKIEQIIDNLE